MTRGRPPLKGLDVAIPIARERGKVMEIVQTKDNPCEFVIIGNGIVGMVRVRKTRRLHSTIAQIEADFPEAIANARTIPGGRPVSRELWLYSRFCVLRFFRILDDGIIELDRHGIPLTNGTESPVTPATTGSPAVQPIAEPPAKIVSAEERHSPTVAGSSGESI